MTDNRELSAADGLLAAVKAPTSIGAGSVSDRTDLAPVERPAQAVVAPVGEAIAAATEDGADRLPARVEQADGATRRPTCACGAAQNPENRSRCLRGHQWLEGPGIKAGLGLDASPHSLPPAPSGDVGARHLELMDRVVERGAQLFEGRPSMRDLPKLERWLGIVEKRRDLAERLSKPVTVAAGAAADIQTFSDSAIHHEIWRRAGIHPKLARTWIRRCDLAEAVRDDSDVRGVVIKALDAKVSELVTAKLAALYPDFVHVSDAERIAAALLADEPTRAEVLRRLKPVMPAELGDDEIEDVDLVFDLDDAEDA